MRFLLPVFACLLAVQASLIPKYRAEKCSRSARPRPQPRRVLERDLSERATKIAPKIFIISMFDSEADVWYENMPNLYDKNITIPGASPLFPDAHCTKAGDVCQLTTGEGEPLLPFLQPQENILPRRRNCRHKPTLGHNRQRNLRTLRRATRPPRRILLQPSSLQRLLRLLPPRRLLPGLPSSPRLPHRIRHLRYRSLRTKHRPRRTNSPPSPPTPD
jgi:hypothetical protein